MGGGVLTSNFDTDIGGVVVQVGDEHFPYQLVEVGILLDNGLHLAREGTNEAVGQKHAKERADQTL